MDVLLGYTVVFLLSFFAIATIPASIISGLLVRIFGIPFQACLFIGFLAVWFAIAHTWQQYYGEPLPVLLVFFLVAFKFGHLIIDNQTPIGGLNTGARIILSVEAMALPVMFIALLVATQRIALI